jgi:amino acid transporter
LLPDTSITVIAILVGLGHSLLAMSGGSRPNFRLPNMLFHGFVVLVGTLILAGAVNTAIIGSNGVLNRFAEDGVLPDWFRHPHKKFGTTTTLTAVGR